MMKDQDVDLAHTILFDDQSPILQNNFLQPPPAELG